MYVGWQLHILYFGIFWPLQILFHHFRPEHYLRFFIKYVCTFSRFSCPKVVHLIINYIYHGYGDTHNSDNFLIFGAVCLDGNISCFCSPMSSSSYRFMDSSRPGSASSQPSATRSHSSGQMFFPAPSNPHKIIHPSCSPPPPYSATDKHMHSSPSSIAEDHLYHGERASPVPAYYNQV